MSVSAGRRGVVYISTTGTGNAQNIISLNQWTLNKTTDKIEVTAFGDTTKTYVQGLPDIQGTFSGFWNDSETKITTAAASTDGCKMYLYPDSSKPTSYHYGPAWLDVSYECPVGGAVTISGNFAANGSWSSLNI